MPKKGDSVFVNQVSVVGDSTNWQNNPDNRRVAQGTYLIAVSYAIDRKTDRSSRKCVVRWR